jgi:hypothetical protein
MSANSYPPATVQPAGAVEPFTGRPGSPVASWLLSIVTFGIYYLFWYHRVNKQAKQIDPSIDVSPGMAVVAITFGAFLIVPPFVSIVKTGSRIAQAQRAAGVSADCSGGLGLLLSFVLSLTPFYYQSQLNRAIEAVNARG